MTAAAWLVSDGNGDGDGSADVHLHGRWRRARRIRSDNHLRLMRSLKAMANGLDKHYKLGRNIDANASCPNYDGANGADLTLGRRR